MAAKLGLIGVPNSCDVLADHRSKQILEATIKDGASLPTEREMQAFAPAPLILD